MENYEDAKKSLASHLTSAEMAVRGKDYKAAYLEYYAAGEEALALSALTLDKKESEDRISLSGEYKDRGEKYLSSLHLSPLEKSKLVPRKKAKGFCEFIGRDEIKDYLSKTIVEPWKNGTYAAGGNFGLRIYGPKGCAKSVLVQSLAHELSATIYYIEPRVNFSVYNSTNAIAHFERLFDKAEEKNNILFYITKAEAYFPKGTDEESRKTSEIFYKAITKERKNIKKKNLNILFVLGTDCPDKVDVSVFQKKFLHPALLNEIVRIHHPNTKTRKERRQERLSGIDIENPSLLDNLAKETHRFVSKKISDVCRSLKKRATIYQGEREKPLLTDERAEKVRKEYPYVEDTTFEENALAFEKSLPESVKLYTK